MNDVACCWSGRWEGTVARSCRHAYLFMYVCVYVYQSFDLTSEKKAGVEHNNHNMHMFNFVIIGYLTIV